VSNELASRAVCCGQPKEGKKRIDGRVFSSSRCTDNVVRITDSLRSADAIGARHDEPIGRAFRCFNGSLLSITIGFMDEQVPRYGELSAWLLASMMFPPPTNSENDRFFSFCLITIYVLLQRMQLAARNVKGNESCLNSETTRQIWSDKMLNVTVKCECIFLYARFLYPSVIRQRELPVSSFTSQRQKCAVTLVAQEHHFAIRTLKINLPLQWEEELRNAK